MINLEVLLNALQAESGSMKRSVFWEVVRLPVPLHLELVEVADDPEDVMTERDCVKAELRCIHIRVWQ